MGIASLSSAFLRTKLYIALRNVLLIYGVETSACSHSVKQPTNMDETLSSYSIHGAHIKDIHDVPFHVLIRPFPSQLEEDKVLSLMKTLQVNR